MSETVETHRAAIADFSENGTLVIKTLDHKRLVVHLGSAQVVSLKRAVDKYVAHCEVGENANKENVAR